MRTIRISEDVWNVMKNNGDFGDSADDVLRQLLGIKESMPEMPIYRSYNDLPQEKTLCKFTYRRIKFNGKIVSRQLDVTDHGKFDTLSSASRSITGTNRNGWNDWYFLLPGETKWILATKWRKIQDKLNSER